MIKRAFTALVLSFFLLSAGIIPPEKHLGFKVGADRKLADYSQIISYFKKLDAASPELKLVKIGKTTLGKDMYMAIITSAENMKKLNKYRELARRIVFSKVNEAELRQAKPIVLISCTLHSTEIGASQMSMELAYRLLARKDPRADFIMKNVILLLVPSSNPDGVDMVVHWYKKWLGTEYEGASLPWLYHHYAGHDDNRDWFMMNLVETRNLTKVFYHDWFPAIILDEHQMGSTGARMFVPPFDEPPTFSVHPIIWRLVDLIGTYMAYNLERKDYAGVVSRALFTAWWIGALDDTAWLHNSVGLLTELASVKLATPIYVEKNELAISWSDRAYDKQLRFPNPWPGGWWRLRDIVNYELEASFATLEFAARNSYSLLKAIYKVNREQEKLGLTEKPYGFIIPPRQHDPFALARMIDALMMGGVKVYRLKKPAVIAGKHYPAGSYYIPLSQPYRPYIKELLEPQHYPNLRLYPDGPPKRPYDMVSWSLPIQMGVKVDPVEEKVSLSLERVRNPYPEGRIVGRGNYVCAPASSNASFMAASLALKEGARLYRVVAPTGKLQRGDFCFTGISKEKARRIAAATHLVLRAVRSLPAAVEVKMPRIAVYKGWGHVMHEGWTRYILDYFKIPYTRIYNKDFKKGKLSERFDVIIFPSQGASWIVKGRMDERYRRFFPPLPPEYKGGIGKEGVKALKKFIEEGGKVVLMFRAVELAWKHLDLPVSNALQRIPSEKFFCPGSFLRIRVRNDLPLGYGMREDSMVVFKNGIALRTSVPQKPGIDRRVVAYFPNRDDLLLSGWLIGGERLKRLAVVVDFKVKKGRVFLLGADVINKAQSHETFKFLLNSLFYVER